jgi:hypothetical protein
MVPGVEWSRKEGQRCLDVVVAAGEELLTEERETARGDSPLHRLLQTRNGQSQLLGGLLTLSLRLALDPSNRPRSSTFQQEGNSAFSEMI